MNAVAPAEHELIMARIDDLKNSIDKMFDRCNLHMNGIAIRDRELERRITALETKVVVFSGAVALVVSMGHVSERSLSGF